MKKCEKCGKAISKYTTECPYCGNKVVYTSNKNFSNDTIFNKITTYLIICAVTFAVLFVICFFCLSTNKNLVINWGIATIVIGIFSAIFSIFIYIYVDSEKQDKIGKIKKEIEDQRRQEIERVRNTNFVNLMLKYRDLFNVVLEDTRIGNTFIPGATIFGELCPILFYFYYTPQVLYIRPSMTYINQKLKDQIIKRQEENKIDYNDFPYWDIRIDDIQYYKLIGDVTTEFTISGGGGGGSSVGGAVVGGVLAGDAGAVIGSRKKVEEVRGGTTTYDKRKTEFLFLQDKKVCRLVFDKEVYEVLKRHIPDKDYEYVQLHQFSKETRINGSAQDRINELKSLLTAGLITQEEYDEKRKEIIKSI